MPAAQRRPWWSAVLVVAAIAALYLLWGRDDAAPSNPTGAPSADAPRDEAGAPSGARQRRSGGAAVRRPLRLSAGEVVRAAADQIGPLEGDVLSVTTDRGVAKARLTFSGPEGLEDVVADEDGHFRFRPGREGSYELAVVAAEGFLPFAPELGHSPVVLVARRGGGVRGVRVLLTPEVDYVGRVVTPEGQPASGATVRVLGRDDEGLSLVDTPDDYRTDDDGEFRFHAMDGVVLEASHPEYDPGRARLDFSAQVSHRLTIRLAPPGSEAPRCAIRGVVKTSQDEPIAEALVAVRSQRTGARGHGVPHPGARTLTDESGAFSFEDLDADTYTVVAESPGLSPRAARGVACPQEDLELTLSPGVSLSGTVREASGEAPVPSFAVVVTEPLNALQHDIVWVESTFDAEGRYEIASLAPGEYRVMVLAHGFAPSPEQRVVLESRPEQVDFSLARGSRIFGTVSDRESTEGIDGARVSLEGQLGRGPHGLPLVTAARSDGEGKFDLRGVPSGEQTLLVAAADHHGRIVSGLMIRDSTDLGPIDVALTPTAEDETPRIELAGIGAVLSAKDDAMIIGRLLEGGGAHAAGLVPGDGILAVDGVSVEELGFKGTIDRIRGPEGTTVDLTVRRAESGETDVMTVERRIVRG